jgi:hypothetical protein
MMDAPDSRTGGVLRCLPLSMLLLCCAVSLGGCIVVPFPSKAEPAPLPEADSIIAGLTNRTQILERLGEPLLVSLDGSRSVHAGIHRSGGGMLFGFGAGYSGGAFIGRFQKLHLVFVRYGEDDTVLQWEHVIETPAPFDRVCMKDGTCVEELLQPTEGFFDEYRVDAEHAVLLAGQEDSEQALLGSADDGCLLYAALRLDKDDPLSKFRPAERVEVSLDPPQQMRVLRPAGFVVWQLPADRYRLTALPDRDTRKRLPLVDEPERIRDIECRGGESRFVEIVLVARKLLPGFRRPYELEIHELDAETGRRTMAARRLILSE